MEIEVSESIPWAKCELQNNWLYLCSTDNSSQMLN